ncbi:lasso peptide biosynthesis PqqD family chaperone [Sporomusa malonica]|uniref:Coenzyme PQQ synthesis protein D (PqqD) n=1 Tax=Sporomusa malonica TaxID=112901 RepID=A0A1W2DL70_9FIRM|nr:lasso peptide biosynthesis PqqD family chaperone [Sporomusa malonica]SMC98173.1 Coenzyme PQQ synthesis protein D (PqqD) [Sporomusa malonica]
MVLPKEILDDTIVVQAPGLIAADMDGETVMLNIEKGTYFGLDGIGSRIWELIEKPHTVRMVVVGLLKEYDVEEKTCQDDVLTFLNQLFAQGLIQID